MDDGSMREILGELRADVRGLREDVAEAKAAAEKANATAQATDKKLDAMRNRGYGFLGGVTLLAGAAGAKLQSFFFGS